MKRPTSIADTFSDKQKILAARHGTPAEFAAAVYKAVPGYISMDEARRAIEGYSREWEEAAPRRKR